MSKPILRSALDDHDEWSHENSIKKFDEGKTQQSGKNDADINIIVKRAGLGYTPPQNIRPPLEGDFTNVRTYQEAFDAVQAADNAFMALHAEVRDRFANDPNRFVKFCTDPKNRDELKKMGLLAPEPEPEKVQKVEVVNTPTPKA